MGTEMKTKMATRGQPGWKMGERCTEFQMHKSQLSVESVRSIIDYTENKLKLFLRTITDPQQKDSIAKVIESYCKGEIAVAWKAGKPVWLQVTKE